MPWAVLNLATRPVQIDDTGSYAIVDDGPRYNVSPMDKGDGDAVFDSFEDAEEWRTTQSRIAP